MTINKYLTFKIDRLTRTIMHKEIKMRLKLFKEKDFINLERDRGRMSAYKEIKKFLTPNK